MCLSAIPQEKVEQLLMERIDLDEIFRTSPTLYKYFWVVGSDEPGSAISMGEDLKVIRDKFSTLS